MGKDREETRQIRVAAINKLIRWSKNICCISKWGAKLEAFSFWIKKEKKKKKRKK